MGEIGPKRREAIVKYVGRYTRQNGWPPSLVEIAEELGIGKSTVWHHLRMLKEEGRVTFEPGRPRTLKVR